MTGYYETVGETGGDVVREVCVYGGEDRGVAGNTADA